MNIEKTYDNEDENLIEPVQEWMEKYLKLVFQYQMDKYKTQCVEAFATDVRNENQTVGYLIVLN